MPYYVNNLIYLHVYGMHCILRNFNALLYLVILSGGYVVIVMREEYLVHVGDYKDRLEPLMKELEISGKWKKMSRKIVPNYSFENKGVIFVFQKL